MRKRISIVCLLLLLANFSYSQQWKADYAAAQKSYENGDLASAGKQAEASLQNFLKEDGQLSDNYAAILRLLQIINYSSGDFSKALEYVDKELSIRNGRQDVLYAGALAQKGTILQTLEDYKNAESFFLQSLSILSQFYQPNESNIVETKLNVAICKYLQGNNSEAQSLFNEALPLMGEEITNVQLQALYYSALINLDQKSFSSAQEKLLKVKSIYEASSLEQSQEFADVLFKLGRSYVELKQFQLAETEFAKSQDLFQKLKINNDEYLSLLNARISNLHALGLDDQANALSKSVENVDSSPAAAAIFLSNKAVASTNKGDFKTAEQLYKEALSKLTLTDAQQAEVYGDIVQNLSVFYLDRGHAANAEKLLLEGLKQFEGRPQVVNFNINLGNTYVFIGNNVKAGLHYNQALSLLNNFPNANPSLRVRALTGIGMIQLKSGEIKSADSVYSLLLDQYNTGSLPKDKHYAAVLNNYAAVKQANGEFLFSRDLLQSTVDFIRAGMGIFNLSYAKALENLADVDLAIGALTFAKFEIDSAILIHEKISSQTSMDYVAALLSLGKYYQHSGEYSLAEPVLRKALAIANKNTDAPVGDWIKTANALAVYYQTMGDYDHAKNLLLEINKKIEKNSGKDSPDYSTNLQNLAGIYQLQGKNFLAGPMLEEALNIDKKVYGINHPQYLITLRNLAAYYQKDNNLVKAKDLLEQALITTRNIYGEEHQEYASTLSNLAALHQDLKNMKEAEAAWLQSVAIRKRILGEEHPDYARSLYGLSNVYFAQGKLKEAKPNYSIVISQYLKQIREYFPSLSEKEKGAFYQKIKPVFDTYQDFCIQYYTSNPTDQTILRDLYNVQLSTKAILLNSTNKVRQTILTSGDTSLVNRFRSWLAVKEKIVHYYALSTEERKSFENIETLTQQANDIEKDLSLKSAIFRSQYKQEPPSTAKIASLLKEGESAMEIIRINKKFMADSVYYVSLMLTSKSDAPSITIWPYGRKLETRLFRFHRNAIKFHFPDTISYKNYWRPLETALSGINKVYISADGIFNKINFNILENSRTGHAVIEDYTVQLVSNTKEIIENAEASDLNHNKNIHLYGYADFHLKLNENHVVHHDNNTLTRAFGFQDEIPLLPATDKEIKEIGALFTSNQHEIVTYKLAEASEYNLKRTPRVKVLHIATHGFFMNDVQVNDTESEEFFSNPLLRSGILLSGAGVDHNEADLKGEDGILTAYEAMNLDLNDTELVVLSACETALGELKNGEGVYGLQRSFIVAGASAVMMSLWQVDDVATQELMVSFYENWLQGNSKQEAFRKAQIFIKEKYKSPFYWGAFILVGH